MPDAQKHDWRRIVRERLSTLRVETGREGEIVAELAAQLEDVYREALSRGMSEADAYQHSLSQFPDWKRLRLDIRRAEEGDGLMNRRVRVFWLPAVATIAVTVLCMFLTYLAGWRWILNPREVPGEGAASVWIALMPYFLAFTLPGAVGAWLAWRAEGTTRERLLVGISPALILLVVAGYVAYPSVDAHPLQVTVRDAPGVARRVVMIDRPAGQGGDHLRFQVAVGGGPVRLLTFPPPRTGWSVLQTGALIPLMFLLIGALPLAFRRTAGDDLHA